MGQVDSLAAKVAAKVKVERKALEERMPFDVDADGKPTKTRRKPHRDKVASLVRDAVQEIGGGGSLMSAFLADCEAAAGVAAPVESGT